MASAKVQRLERVWGFKEQKELCKLNIVGDGERGMRDCQGAGNLGFVFMEAIGN